MQTPSSEMAIFPWKMRTVLRRINSPIYIFWVLVDCIYNLRWHTWIFKCVADQKQKSFKSGQIYRKDAEYAETNEKSISPFLVFEIKFLE